MERKYFETQIRNALERQAGSCSVPKDARRSIDQRIALASKKEEKTMSRFNSKKIAAAAVLAVALTGTVCYASGKAFLTVSISNSAEDYTDFADLGKAEKKAGVVSDAVETFPNGFIFESASVVDVHDTDHAGNALDSWKELYVDYQNEDGRTVSLSAGPDRASEAGKDSAGTYEQGGITYHCNTMTDKNVPEGYEPTAEELEAMENGTLNIAEGSDEIEISEYASVQWVENGTSYLLSGFDVELDELKQMAEYLNQ